MKWRGATFCALAALCLAAVLSATLGAQTKVKPAVTGSTAIKVDGNIIKSYIAYMAADEREGRRSLTPGYEKTAEWAAAKFKEWGLKPAGDNGGYLQDVPVTGYAGNVTWTTGVPELTVDGRPFYLRDGDFSYSTASTPGAQINAEVVFVGYGISALSKGLEEYAGVDVEGKIVLALKGSPKDAPAARGMMGGDTPAAPRPDQLEAWTEESKDQAKIKAAYEKGAAAILLFDVSRISSSQAASGLPPGVIIVSGGMVGSAPDVTYSRPFQIVTDVNERVFKQVMWRDLQESSRGFIARIDQIRRDIRDKKARSTATGVKAQIKGYATATFYNEKLKNNITHNVVGKVEGVDPVLKNQYVVIGGHLDHNGMTNSVIFNGADDDASGAALTMEMGRLIAANAATIKPKRTIIFALWAAEEQGLVGSNFWTKTPSDGVKMENVVTNFNCDMVGLGTRIGAPGALNFPAIFDVIMKDQDPEVAKVVDPSTSGPGGSDYSGFIEKGIEALALMTSGGVGHPDYHDAGDDTAKIDPEILRKTGQFVLQGTINVANETATPLVIADRQHLYDGMRMRLLSLGDINPAGGVGVMIVNGVVQQLASGSGPRFSVALSDVSALGGNLALIDVAAKLMTIGRVDVKPNEARWFASTGLTEAGKTALKEFETAGIVLNFINPARALLDSLLDNARRGFIVSSVTIPIDGGLAKRMKEKNVILAVAHDLSQSTALAGRLIELKKLFDGSDNLVIVSADTTLPADQSERRKIDEAKQQMYILLIKAGWTKDEIYAMVGVTPPAAMAAQNAMRGRLSGNFSKLLQSLPAGGPQ
jgi:hypothetical protein